MTAEVVPIRPDVEPGSPPARHRVFRAVISIYEDDDLCGQVELDFADRWDGHSGRACAWLADEFHNLTAMDARVSGGYIEA